MHRGRALGRGGHLGKRYLDGCSDAPPKPGVYQLDLVYCVDLHGSRRLRRWGHDAHLGRVPPYDLAEAGTHSGQPTSLNEMGAAMLLAWPSWEKLE